MKLLSLKLREDVFEEVEQVVHKLHMPRNAYINQALFFYNQLNRRKLLRKQLQGESKVTRSVSLDVLREFEAIEDALA